MIPDQTFHCPHCGAPGHVKNGETEYACQCRFNALLRAFPVTYPVPYPVPAPYPYTPPPLPYTITWGPSTTIGPLTSGGSAVNGTE